MEQTATPRSQSDRLPGGFELRDIDAVWPTLNDLPAGAEAALDICHRGQGLCFVADWGTFVIGLEPGQNPGTLEAFVYLAIAARHGAFDAAEPAVIQVARDLKATTVAFRSVRRGWARRLGPAWMPRGTREFWRWTDERRQR
jgi:hypothetical protein